MSKISFSHIQAEYFRLFVTQFISVEEMWVLHLVPESKKQSLQQPKATNENRTTSITQKMVFPLCLRASVRILTNYQEVRKRLQASIDLNE